MTKFLQLKKEILTLECNRCRGKMLKAYYELIENEKDN
jgi:hypothetical protein